MLRKLLKYDLRATLKYWWIAALSTIAVSFIGGVSVNLLSTPLADTSPFVTILSYFGFLLAILGLSAFLIASAIFIYVRFYQNCFSDEGYLTFTLPVKRSAILNSKLISAMIVSLATSAVLMLDIIIIILITTGRDIFSREFIDSTYLFINEVLNPVNQKLILYFAIYAIEEAFIALFASLFSILLVFVCISFASMITKKNKVFAAIGIYYIVNAILSGIIQLIGYFTIFGAISWISLIPPENVNMAIALILLVIILISVPICLATYIIALWLMDRKLNLA